MGGLLLDNIKKVYNNGFEVVKNFNLEIEDKEFVIMVIPYSLSAIFETITKLVMVLLLNLWTKKFFT